MKALETGMKVISSREIAEATEKEHRNVMIDIRNMCEQGDVKIHSAEISAEFDNQDVIVIESDYEVDLGHTKRPAKEYLLNEMASELLATGYDVKRRLAVLRLLKEMKTALENKFVIVQSKQTPIEIEIVYKLSEATSILKTNAPYPIGKYKIYKELRIRGIMNEHNHPLPEFIERGYFENRLYNDEAFPKYPVVTEEGIKWLRQLLFPQPDEKLKSELSATREGVEAILENMLLMKSGLRSDEQNRAILEKMKSALAKMKSFSENKDNVGEIEIVQQNWQLDEHKI